MHLFRRVELNVKLLFLTVLYLAGNACFLQAQASGTANPDSVLTDISAAEDHGSLNLTLAVANVPIPPKVSKLSDPDRLIFDFAGVLPKAGITRTKVGTHSVRDVRAAIFGNDARGRPITRVVLDLEKPVAYETRNEPGKFMIIVRENGAATSASIAAAKMPASPAAKPVAPPRERPTVPGSNRLTNIDFGDSRVTLTFNSAVSPRKSTLHDPERLVLDLPGVVAGLPSTKSIPDTLRSSLTGIRMAQFKEDPPLYRIVFDEASPNTSSQMSIDGNQVVLQFGLNSEKANRTVPRTQNAITAKRVFQPTLMSPPLTTQRSITSTRGTTPKKVDASGRGPKVDYTNGLLRIEATNANLADVLYAVGEKTGAVIDMPFSDSMLDQVTFTMGPGKPRDVLSTILEGSGFNYYIVENSSGGLEKIILIPKQE